ncbi:hypothetical protein BGX21_000967 [Mortierella sp. AD011]|nr:hypothetical protein BGX21_000967 [Mortierella sp. AD011]
MNEMRELDIELAKLGQEYDRENKSPVRANGIKTAAPRALNVVKVFRDRENCDIDGWNTFSTFWISKYLVTENGGFIKKTCFGHAENPSRAMHFSDRSDCNYDGWTHDFTMDMQAWKLAGPPNLTKMAFWIHPNTGRMLITLPHHDETVSGWTLRYRLSVDMMQGAMNVEQKRFLKDKYSEHSELHKRSLVDRTRLSVPANPSYFKLMRHAIHYVTDPMITRGGVKTLQSGVTHRTKSGILRHMVNIQLQYGDKSYAGILIEAGIYNTRIIAHALIRSLYETRMMTVHKDERPGNAGRTIVEAVLIDGVYRRVISSWIKGDKKIP